MEAIVVGAGQAGTHIAQVLSMEHHNVTLIDTNRERILRVEETLDVRTICDHGASPQILELAGAGRADLVAAMTDKDEVKLIACVTARQLGAKKTAARVYNQVYLVGEKIEYQNILGIDLIISPQTLTAFEIAKMIENPAAVTVETFAQGKVQMRQMVVREDSLAAGQAIRQLFPPDRDFESLMVALSRNGEIAIPGSKDVLQVGDRVTVVMPAGRSSEIRRLFNDVEDEADNVVIAGGGTTAQMLAQTLERRGVEVTLIESDRDRCEALSRLLDHTRVIYGDATARSVLEEERVGQADAFIALCGNDEVNLMSSLQAREMGVHHALVVVNKVDYGPLVERVGIDHAVSPRILTGNRILTLAEGAHVSSIALIQDGRAEVVEYRVETESKVVNRMLGDGLWFPKGSIVGALVRGDEVIVPRGGDTFLPGDRVIAFVLSEVIEELNDMFICLGDD